MEDNRIWRRDHGAMLSGVCAGLAEDLDLPLPLVRMVSVVFVVLPTGLAYLALSLLLRRLPVQSRMRQPGTASRGAGSRWPASNGAAASSHTGPRPLPQSFALLVHRFEALEPRLKRIEAFVTSNEFELNRDFRRMGE